MLFFHHSNSKIIINSSKILAREYIGLCPISLMTNNKLKLMLTVVKYNLVFINKLFKKPMSTKKTKNEHTYLYFGE